MKSHIVVALVMTLTLAGCGVNPGSLAPTSTASGQLAALKKGEANPSYEAGVSAGLVKAAEFHKTKAPARGIRIPQGEIDQPAYDRGYVVGLLQGSINSYNRIAGEFEAAEWAAFAKMNYEAMKDALRVLKANKELETKYGKAEGILEGGISSYDTISGSFDASEWKQFANANHEILKRALDAMKQ